MALTQRLDLRQSQSLVMTPQLQQAIKLLQLSNIELVAYVERELEQNPLLEREDAGSETDSTRDDNDEDARTPDSGAAEPDTADLTAREAPPAEDSGPLDADYDNVWSDETGANAAPTSSAPHARADGEDGNLLEQTVAEMVTLRDHLVDQLTLDVSDPAQRMIGLHLIDSLNEAGYVSVSLESVAEQLGCTLDAAEATLLRLQAFDPPGIFARDLAECLAIQLKEKDRFDPAMQALIENLELLGKRDVASLLRICGVDVEDLTDMVAEIRALDPKPALAFTSEVAQPVVPDILLSRKPDGSWHIELNSETLPRVLVNQRYHTAVSGKARDKKDREYIAEQLQAANWLVRSLHQRATTILKVAAEIVRQQDAFFSRGVHHLRPLVLRDIADAIGMHESTVSRVTTNKYIATPRGLYELKYFFTTAIASSEGGDAHSAEAVRHRIRSLIDAEQAKAVLSDDQIVTILKAEGIDIARRTVAKYREAMHIPSSVQRRREKATVLAI